MDKIMASKILKHLEVQKNEMLQFLKQLVMIETPSSNSEAQKVILSLLKNKIEALGYYVFHKYGKETGGYLYARPINRNKKKPVQLLIGHCDTVWAIDTIKEMPIKSDGNKLRGPGIYDMKAGLTQILYAIKAIQELSLKPAVSPIILINSDEEIGSKESTNIIKMLSKIADRAYILEPPLGLEGKLKTSRKGIGRFTVHIKGRAAHAGLDPSKGVNAIVEMSYQVQKLFAMNNFDKGITVNVGMIEGGTSANVIAPESKAVVDVRVLTKKDGIEITKKIHALKPELSDTLISINGGIGRPPMENTPGNKKLWELAKVSGNFLGLNLEEVTAGGGSDGNTTSLYTPTLDGLGTTGDGAHAKHEFIFSNQLPDRAALLTLLLLANPVSNIKNLTP